MAQMRLPRRLTQRGFVPSVPVLMGLILMGPVPMGPVLMGQSASALDAQSPRESAAAPSRAVKAIPPVPLGSDLAPALARAHRANQPLLIYVFDRA